MAVTINDIAKELNVSPSAVSKVLNNRPGIGSELRLKIQDYAEKMGYKPYMATREHGMYNQDLNIIAVIYPQSLGSHLIRKVQDGLDTVLYKSQYYELRFAVDIDADLKTMEKRELFLRRIITIGNLSGIVFAFIQISDKIINFLQKNNIPSVLINTQSNVGKCVYVDDSQTAYNVTNEMIKLGRRRIGLLIPEEMSAVLPNHRLMGYMKALEENKISYDPNLIVYENTYVFKNIIRATKKLVEENSDMDAVIFNSDIQAFAGIKTLKAMNKRIPEDIAVIGFDNMDFDMIVEPSLSSVYQPLKEMGLKGAELLLKAIKEKNFKPEKVKLDTKIIMRKSCLPDFQEEDWL